MSASGGWCPALRALVASSGAPVLDRLEAVVDELEDRPTDQRHRIWGWLARRPWQVLDEAAAEIGGAMTDQIEQACLRALVRHVSRRGQIYPEPGSPGEAAWWKRAYRHLSIWSGINGPLQPERRDRWLEGPDFEPPRSRPQHAVELSWLDAWAINVCAAAWRCGPCIPPWPVDRPDVADVARLPEWRPWPRVILDAMLRYGARGVDATAEGL